MSPAGEPGLLSELRGAHLGRTVIQMYVLISVRPEPSAPNLLNPHASCAGCLLTSVNLNFLSHSITMWSLGQFLSNHGKLEAINVAHIDEVIVQVKVIFYFRFHSFS